MSTYLHNTIRGAISSAHQHPRHSPERREASEWVRAARRILQRREAKRKELHGQADVSDMRA